jgi:flagellar biosynthetic protein FlhB
VSRSQDRTERPTERRKREARREGRVAKSQEIGAALSLIGLAVSIRLLAPGAASAVAEHTRSIFTSATADGFGPNLRSDILAIIGVALVPFLGVAVALATAGGIGQVGFTLAPKAAKPKLSNLSLKRGLQKFKPSVFGWDLARTALKLGLLVVVIWTPLTAWMSRLGRPLGLGAAIASTGDQVWILLLRATVLAIAVAAADYAVIKFRTNKELKMTKQEVKDEYKQQEGDPIVRQARRRRAMEMSRNRMIADVASADVVVTNPTHLAVALRYDTSEAAPRVVAKGAGKLAKKIRAQAYRNGVTVLEDKPLARSLYRTVKVGHFVPEALFEAVATILAVAYRRRRRRAVVA